MLKVLVYLEAKHGRKVKSDKVLLGYFQTLGVTARDDRELMAIVRQFIYDDLESELIDVPEIWVPDFEVEDSDIKDVCRELREGETGIWYHSARLWFSEDDIPGEESYEVVEVKTKEELEDQDKKM